MGWVEPPPFFCAAAEMVQDVATNYIDTPVGSLPSHKFEHYSVKEDTVVGSTTSRRDTLWRYLLEVYVDDFIALVIPT